MNKLLTILRNLPVGKQPLTVGQFALFGLLLLATSAQGQRATDKAPVPRATPPTSTMVVEPWPMDSARSNSSGPPSSSVSELTSSLAELKTNVQLLQVINDELQHAVTLPNWPDYELVATDASDIKKLAIRLMRNFSLAQGDLETAEIPKAAASTDQLRAAILALDESIKVFLNDPVVNRSRTVDAGELVNVGANLEKTVSNSSAVMMQVAYLAGRAGKSTVRIKSRLKPHKSMQLTIECQAWSVSELLKRPAAMKGQGTIELGIRIQTRRHKLAQPMILPVNDCVDGESYEKARADNIQYVAIVTDFVSFEVKGKIFAYQVDYEIGFTQQGAIAKRFQQPLSFYYVDDSGDGDFELLKGPVATGLVPEWARDLAAKH
jgi:hypothetical protein